MCAGFVPAIHEAASAASNADGIAWRDEPATRCDGAAGCRGACGDPASRADAFPGLAALFRELPVTEGLRP